MNYKFLIPVLVFILKFLPLQAEACDSSIFIVDFSSEVVSWQNTGVMVTTDDLLELTAEGLVRVWAGGGSELWVMPLGECSSRGTTGTAHLLADCIFFASPLRGVQIYDSSCSTIRSYGHEQKCSI